MLGQVDTYLYNTITPPPNQLQQFQQLQQVPHRLYTTNADTCTMDTLPNEMLSKVLQYLCYGEMGKCLTLCKRWQTLLEDLLPPTTLVFSSGGLVAEHWGGLMGQYVLLPEKHSNLPAYIQHSTIGKDRPVIFCCDGWWWVSYELGNTEYASLRARDQGLGLPPATDWEYFNLRRMLPGSWVTGDSTLAIGMVIEPVAEIELDNTGEGLMGERAAACTGMYHPMEGCWVRGRPVYKKKGDEGKVLVVLNSWVAKEDVMKDNRARAFMKSRRGTNSPGDPLVGGWLSFREGEWGEVGIKSRNINMQEKEGLKENISTELIYMKFVEI